MTINFFIDRSWKETPKGAIKSGWNLFQIDSNGTSKFLEHFESARDAEKRMEKLSIKQTLDEKNKKIEALEKDLADALQEIATLRKARNIDHISAEWEQN